MSFALRFPGRTSVIICDSLYDCIRKLDMDRSHGGERFKGIKRKDKCNDLRYGPGTSAELMLVTMRCLSYRSMQQPHLLQ